MSREEAYRHCERLAKRHYENFTVGSWLLPRGMRSHVWAIYAFCRTTDDLGDEAAGDRLAGLDAWEEALLCALEGGERPDHPVLLALGETARRFQLPVEPFLKLIEANRMDQRNRRYRTLEDLLFYCEHSANPVGHLVLHLFGYRDAGLHRLADHTCTALQLTNFLQDIAVDLARDRIYLPREDLARFGYGEEDLRAGVVDGRFRALMRFELGRTRELFACGLELLRYLDRHLRADVKLFSLGGLKVLEAIERAGYDVFRRRPTLSRVGKVRLLLGVLLERVGARTGREEGRAAFPSSPFG